MSKKSTKRFLALLCTISLIVTSLFVVEAEDETTAVTMPEELKGYTVVTPQTFGVQDTNNEAVDADKNETISLDKLLFAANVTRVDDETTSKTYLYYLQGPTGQSICRLQMVPKDDRIYFYNEFDYSADSEGNKSVMYRGDSGTGTTKAYGSSGSSNYFNLKPSDFGLTSFVGSELQIWITTEFVKAPWLTEGEADDLKIGIWMNGQLYNYNGKGTYFYVLDCKENTYREELRTNNAKLAISTPAEFFRDELPKEFTFDSSPAMPEELEKYRIVTPLTYGVPDSTNSNGLRIDAPTRSTTRTSIDNVLFSARVRFKSGGNSSFTYLKEPTTTSGLLFLRPNGYSALWIRNYMRTDSVLYVGDDGAKEIPYKDSTNTNNCYYKIKASDAGLTTFEDVEFQLWITTEFVKAPWLEEGEAADDLKIGIWINGRFINNLYVLDCKNLTYRDSLTTSNMVAVASDMLEPSDMSVVAGEYTSVSDSVYTSDLVANKNINGVMFHSDVRFEGLGGTLSYGCSADDQNKAIKLTSTADGIIVSHTYGEEEVALGRIVSSQVGTDVIDNTFSLKLRTDIVDADTDGNADDIQLGIWINEKYCCCYITDAASYITARMRMECRENSSIVLGVFGEATPEELDWCLDEGRLYEVDKSTSMTKLSVDGVDTVSKTIDEPGTYSIVYVKSGKVYMQDLTVYRSYDLNENNAVDVADIVRMKRVANEATEETAIAALGAAGRKAISYDESTWTDEQAQETLAATRQTILETEEIKVSVMELMEDETVYNYSFDFLGGTKVMPIGGFYGPIPKASVSGDFDIPNYISDNCFSMIEECGVNLIVFSDVYYDTNPNDIRKILELGEKYGVGITVKDRRYSKAGDNLTTELAQSYLSDYDYYRAFCGVHAIDEPTSSDYGFNATLDNTFPISNYAKQINTLSELGVWSYGNLLPCYNYSYGEAYTKYVTEWLDTCNVDVLMWDKYVHESNNIDAEANYFYNMSLGREMANKYKVPFWTFVQGGVQLAAGSNYSSVEANSPSKGEFLWNVNTCLAYGAKGLSYFPLIQPDYFAKMKDGTYNFRRNGLIGADGNKNAWWYYAQTANKQIAAIDTVLMNSVNKGVIITSLRAKLDNIYSSCILDGTSWREMKNISGDVMVGCFNYQGKSAFYVVNYDMKNTQEVAIDFFDNYQFRVIQNATTSRHRAKSLGLTMEAGEGVLVVME